MVFDQIKDFDAKIKALLFKNDMVKEKALQLNIEGDNPWELYIIAEWKDLGNIVIEPASLYDIWALKEWYYGLSFRSRNFISIFPVDHRNEKYMAMHLKKNQQKKCIIFNAWKEDEIIGHFFVSDIENKPEVSLGISDKYQKNKLGHFFLTIIIDIFKIYGFRKVYLTTMHENKNAFHFYKKLGFELIGDTKVPVPGFDYQTDEYAMSIDVEKF
jgi:RimJ/RimL family protein N-acetyltransferase